MSIYHIIKHKVFKMYIILCRIMSMDNFFKVSPIYPKPYSKFIFVVIQLLQMLQTIDCHASAIVKNRYTYILFSNSISFLKRDRYYMCGRCIYRIIQKGEKLYSQNNYKDNLNSNKCFWVYFNAQSYFFFFCNIANMYLLQFIMVGYKEKAISLYKL